MPTIEEVRIALDARRSRETGKKGNLAALVVTLLVFMAFGLFSFSFRDIIVLVVVIFVHEFGHFIGMKIFGYRDVRVFFIPLIGAATAGVEHRPSEVKSVLISLFGPFTGIVFGIAAGVAYFFTSDALLLLFARMSLFINVLNLLPFYPLDGGRIVERTVFSRSYKAELVFKLITAVLLACLAFMLSAPLLCVFCVLILLPLRAQYRSGRIAGDIIPSVPDKDREDADRIPDEHLSRIVDALAEKLSEKSGTASVFAQYAQAVWRRVCTRRLGAAAVFGLLLLYSALFFIGVIAPLALEVGVHLSGEREEKHQQGKAYEDVGPYTNYNY